METVRSESMNDEARQEAEKNRRGIEILKEKSEQHGAAVCTTSGRPPDPDYAELNNAPEEIDSSGQHKSYYILCEDERRKGFVRPVRRTYIHVGIPTPKNPLRDLTEEEHARYDQYGYVKFEEYPEAEGSSVTGRFWTQERLNRINAGCNRSTTMALSIAETFARDPNFYGAGMCVHCRKHFPNEELVWEDGSRVGS